MGSFSAVVTTGIYCRSGCSARPSSDNVRRYELAAAAEAAGYRACLRCRPYRSPEPAVMAASELVCRGVQLIIDGALDGAGEVTLARRLGVSVRHLRRLFSDQIGVTPDQLARSRRAHFARRLLDDTDLTVTDIAFASGYGSVRQLNRACQEVFRASPRELRDRRHRRDRLVADGGLLLRLPFAGPLDWDAMLAYLGTRAIPGVEHVGDDAYRRTVVVDGDPGVLEMTPGDDQCVYLRAHLPHWEGLIHIVERARKIFALDVVIDEANRHLVSDDALGVLIETRPGIRMPGTWDAFEIGVRAIIGQQVSVAGATTIAGRLVERAGNVVSGLGPLGLTHTFPTPGAVLRSDLDGIGVTTARAAAIKAFAAAIEHDRIRLDRSVSLDDLVAAITSLPGMGPWTAHYIAVRLGEQDAMPTSDLGLRRAFDRLAPRTATTLECASPGWSPWRATAAAQLWMNESLAFRVESPAPLTPSRAL